MAHKSKSGAEITWANLMEMVSQWSDEMGVDIKLELHLMVGLSEGGYVVVQVTDTEGGNDGRPLERQRHPFPARKGSGHAGAVCYAIFQTLVAINNTPWNWSAKMRREMHREE